VFAIASVWDPVKHWGPVKQVLASLALGLALFICIWVSRVFFAGQVLGPVIPMSGLGAIAVLAIIGGALPALALGFGYGLMRPRQLLTGAVIVAVLGCVVELATSSAAVPWWTFITWWVLPIECIAVVVVFVGAALAGARSLPRLLPPTRPRLGAAVFVVMTLGAVTWPWLYSCIYSNVCSLVPP
jgi:hypothetical protein